MRIGVDGSNLRAGGGVTHLVELLAHAEPGVHGVTSVTVWGGRQLLDRLPDRPWLVKSCQAPLNGSMLSRIRWRRSRLRALAAEAADLLFVPGSSDGAGFHPFVTMCRTMLPFQPRERGRFWPHPAWLRLLALRVTQPAAFRRADGVIFLSEFARQELGDDLTRTTVIPHGVGEQFRIAPREQHDLSAYTAARPFTLLYTSVISEYKHQWNVARAVIDLRREGYPVALDLVGPSYPPALRKLRRAIRHDSDASVRVRGNVQHRELPAVYRAADAFVFASTCENMPNILLEAMASGLPIACSSFEPMPRFLGDAGIYFDPTDPGDVKRAIRELLEDPVRRAALAQQAWERAGAWTWTRCANDTFAFLKEIARAHGAADRRAP